MLVGTILFPHMEWNMFQKFKYRTYLNFWNISYFIYVFKKASNQPQNTVPKIYTESLLKMVKSQLRSKKPFF